MVFANFHGVISPTMTDFKLPKLSHEIWEFQRDVHFGLRRADMTPLPHTPGKQWSLVLALQFQRTFPGCWHLHL